MNDLTQQIAYNIISTKINYDNGVNNSQTPNATGYTVGLSMVIQVAKFIIYHQQTNCTNTNQTFALNGFCFGIDYSNGTRTETDCTNTSGFTASSLLSTNIQWNIVPLNYSGTQYDSQTPPSTIYTFRQPIYTNNTLSSVISSASLSLYKVTSTQIIIDSTGTTNSSGLYSAIIRNNSLAYSIHGDNQQGGLGASLYQAVPLCLVAVTIEERSANNIQNCTNTITNVLNELRANATSIRSDVASTNTTAGSISVNNTAISQCVWGASQSVASCKTINKFIDGR
ncbi:hypothetical protein HYU06_05780 [Candidatus Woesearchaeota archaeon]|nr:hypothetical protein [Candidatus Woesearchaeota archaeon]